MKHLKTYNNSSEDDLSKLKKYIIFPFIDKNTNIIEYYIDTIKTISNNFILIEMLYNYNQETQTLSSIEKGTTTKFHINKYLENILFTSDNINDCLNFIKLHTISNKYNL